MTREDHLERDVERLRKEVDSLIDEKHAALAENRTMRAALETIERMSGNAFRPNIAYEPQPDHWLPKEED